MLDRAVGIDIYHYVRGSNFKDVLYLGLLSFLAFVAYPICYFSGLQLGQPVVANIINYTWPIIGVVVGLMVSRRSVSLEAFLAVVLGFCGSAIVLRTALPSGTQQVGVLTAGIWDLGPYALSAMGALSYGAFSGLVNSIRGTHPLSVRAQFLIMLLIASLMQLIIVFMVATQGGVQFKVAPDRDKIIALVIYAIGFAIAHFSWLFAVKTLKPGLPLVSIYMTPVLSTAILAVVHSAGFSVNTVPGLVCILIGIYLAQHLERPVAPLAATMLALFVSWALTMTVFTSPQAAAADAISMQLNVIQLLLALFAILSGFTLNNTIQRNTKGKLHFVSYATCIKKVERQFHDNAAVVNAADKCLQAAIEENFSDEESDSQSAIRAIEELEAKLNVLVDEKDKEALWCACVELRMLRGSLEYLRTNGVSNYEWFILILLSVVMILLVYSIQALGAIFLLLRTGLVGALVLVLCAIRDFNMGRPTKLMEFIIQAQLTGETNPAIPPYVSRYALMVAADGAHRFAKWEVRSRDEMKKPWRGVANAWRISGPSRKLLWVIVATSGVIMFWTLT